MGQTIRDKDRLTKISGGRNPVAFRRGSLTIEYAVLIAVVVAALVGMAVVMKRALNDRYHEVGGTFGFGRQSAD